MASPSTCTITQNPMKSHQSPPLSRDPRSQNRNTRRSNSSIQSLHLVPRTSTMGHRAAPISVWEGSTGRTTATGQMASKLIIEIYTANILRISMSRLKGFRRLRGAKVAFRPSLSQLADQISRSARSSWRTYQQPISVAKVKDLDIKISFSFSHELVSTSIFQF